MAVCYSHAKQGTVYEDQTYLLCAGSSQEQVTYYLSSRSSHIMYYDPAAQSSTFVPYYLGGVTWVFLRQRATGDTDSLQAVLSATCVLWSRAAG
jgi:hypothetical protein